MKDKNDHQTIDAFKPQPMSNAERQRLYRQRQKNNTDGSKRLDVMIDADAYSQLHRIAESSNVSMRQVLERLIMNDGELRCFACRGLTLTYVKLSGRFFCSDCVERDRHTFWRS